MFKLRSYEGYLDKDNGYALISEAVASFNLQQITGPCDGGRASRLPWRSPEVRYGQKSYSLPTPNIISPLSLSLKSVEATFDGVTFKQLASLPEGECDACLVEIDGQSLLHIGGFLNGTAVHKYR